MATKQFDPLEGVTSKTTKDDLIERLRKAASMMRRDDNKKKKRLAEIEERLTAKRASRTQEELRAAIISNTDAEWTELVEFLEEFEDLAPVGALRIISGGRALLGQIPVEDDVAV